MWVIRGFRTNRLRSLTVAAGLILFSVTAPHAAPPPEWGLQPLMTAMRQVRSSTARFQETKYSHLLNQALRSSGQLSYVAPNWLQKQTTEPVPSRLTIAGDRLTIERQGQPAREISLQDNSEIAALVDSARATLAGDLPALTRHFTTALDGNAARWTLTLTPREASLPEHVTTIRIAGEQTAIREIETTEADGDRTVTTISPETK